MRYRLRTLLIVLAVGPIALAVAWFFGIWLERFLFVELPWWLRR